MKKYSARRVGLGARNLFRSGGGRTEVRAPVGLRRCRSEATVPYRRLGVSKSTVDSHFRANLPATNPPLTPTAVELRSADFSPPPLGTCKSAGSGMNSALQVLRNWLNSTAVPLTPPRRGTDCARTNACSPPRRGRGWVGSWRYFFRF